MTRKIVGDTACPGCRDMGRDKTGNHLILFDDGSATCSRDYCDYKVSNYEKPEKVESRVEVPRVELSDISEMMPGELKNRKLSSTTLDHFGVKIEYDSSGDPDRYYIPVTKAGEVTGYKTKLYDKDDPDRFSQKQVGDIKGRIELFGQSACKGGKRRLIITEGQEDAMAAWQMLNRMQADTKWQDKSIHCVSLQMGATSAEKTIKDNWDFLSKYSEILLALDNDEAGQKASQVITKALGYKNVKIMEWDDYKDCGEMLQAGSKGREAFREAFFNAKAYKPSWYMRGADMDLQWLTEAIPDGLDIPFESLNNKLKGLRFREMSVFCGGSGSGKSTLVKAIAYHLNAVHKCRIGKVFLEEQARRTAQSVAALHYKIPIHKLEANPDLLTADQWKYVRKKLLKREAYVDHFGSLPIEDVMDRLHYLWQVEGCNVIIIDHLTMVTSGLGGSGAASEREMIDLLMTELAAFTVKTGVMLLCVVHLKRKDGKSFSRGGKIEMSDLRGSSQLECLSWNIVGVQRDMLADGQEANTVTPVVLKNRTIGTVGECGTLRYNESTGWLEDAYKVVE